MKNFFRLISCIAAVMITVTSSAQFQSNTNQSNSSTKVNYLGGLGASVGLQLGDFTDTTTLNTNAFAKGVPGIIERTGNGLVIRNTTANRWLGPFAMGAFNALSLDASTLRAQLGGDMTKHDTVNGKRLYTVLWDSLQNMDIRISDAGGTFKIRQINSLTSGVTFDQSQNSGMFLINVQNNNEVPLRTVANDWGYVRNELENTITPTQAAAVGQNYAGTVTGWQTANTFGGQSAAFVVGVKGNPVADSALSVQAVGVSGIKISAHSLGNIRFTGSIFEGVAEYGRFAATTGFLGLNTITPTHQLTVNGQIRINSINNAAIFDSALFINNGVIEAGLASNLSIPISSLLPATKINTIDNTNFLQEWQWSTLSGSALKLSTTSIAAAGNLQKMLEITMTGANATASQTTYGIYVNNDHTGTTPVNYGVYSITTDGIGISGTSTTATGVFGQTSTLFGVYGSETGAGGIAVYASGSASSGVGTGVLSQVTGPAVTNVGGQFEASGATNNNAIIVPSNKGRVGIGITTPDSLFQVNGSLKFVTGRQGAGKVLSSDANGGADWTTPSGGTVTNIATGLGLSGGPITTTGTIIVDTTVIADKAAVTNITSAWQYTTVQKYLGDGLGVTQSATKGILLINNVPAALGAQQISPAMVLTGNGWGTGLGSSQVVSFRQDILPTQGSTPTVTWQLASSVNGGSFNNQLTIRSDGLATFTGALIAAGITSTQGGSINNTIGAGTQVRAGQASNTAAAYRLTNAGGDVTPQFAVQNTTITAGTLSTQIDMTNNIVLSAANGTRQIARAGIAIINLNNGAGTEAGDLSFLTQTGGAAMSNKVTILGAGGMLIGAPTTDANQALNIQSLTNTASDGIRVNAANNTASFKMGYQTLITSGGMIIQASSTGIEMVGPSGTGVSISTSNIAPTSTLMVDGSFGVKISSSAIDVTLDATMHTMLLTATGKTATLPTAVGITDRIYIIKLTAVGSGTVATTSSQTIDGATTYSLASQYKYVSVQSDGSNWNVIANN